MKKIYIEISDICGLKCDFCPAPKGVRGVMDLTTFKKAAFEARRFTRLIALHILGDPLKIENLAEYLAIAKEANLSVEITTSGANLSDFDLLLKAPIKQVNFSLDALKSLKNAPFLMRRICDFCAYKVQKKSEIFINLRIQKRAENREIIEFLAQNLGNLNPCEAPKSRPLRGAKNRIQGCRSATTDFLLEAEKARHSPKSEKRQLLGNSFKNSWGEWAGGAALFAKETNKISGKGGAEFALDSATFLQGGLPRRFCESARNDEFLDSSLRKCSAQNDNLGLDSANPQNLGQNRIKLGNKIIIDFRDVFKWNIEDNAINAESSLDSAHFLDSTRFKLSTQKANSSIFDESQRVVSEAKQKSELCSCEQGNRTDGSLTKRATKQGEAEVSLFNLSDLSHPTGCERSEAKKDAEFGTCLALKTHLGILSDGTIVPCCIDASGNLALGNIKEISLDSALKSVRAQKMLQGFRENRLIEPFCQKCDYKNRFT